MLRLNHLNKDNIDNKEMNGKGVIIKLSRGVALLLCILVSLAALAGMDGRWVLHPSADMYSYTGQSYGYNHSLKIMDGDRYAYFWVMSQPHIYEKKNYDTTEAMIYRVDKSRMESADMSRIAPVSVMESLAEVMPVSGLLVSAATYSPEGKYLVLAYQDGVVDIVYDDGRVLTCTALRDFTYPCDKSINSLTADVDGRGISVGTSFGYVTIDAATGGITSLRRLNAKVDYVSRVGDRMVLVSGDKLYAFGIEKCPTKLSEIEPVKGVAGGVASKYLNSDGSLYAPNNVAPLSDDSFVYLTHAVGQETTGPYVNVATFAGEEVRVVNVSEDLMDYTRYGYGTIGRYNNLNEGIITPSKRGYIINKSDRVIELMKGGDIPSDADDINAAQGEYISKYVIKRDKTGFGTLPTGTSEKHLAIGSYDGENYWMYYPLQGYKHRQVTGTGASAVWSSVGEGMMPNAANAFRATYIDHVPGYGMMMRNNSNDSYYDLNANHADALCGYRDGKWTYYGLAKSNYAKRQINPVPRGIGYDPLNPKYLWSGSMEYGLTRLNLEDPTDILRLTRSNMSGVGTAGCYAVHTSSKGWANLSCFSAVSYDNDNTMWCLFCDWDNTGIGGVYSMWYLTADDRVKSENASRDASAFIMPRRIEIPIDGITSRSRIWPMRHERNRNLLGITSGHYFDSAILDHNGTLEDTSDDKVVYLCDIYDSNDNKMSLTRGVYMYDDPYDGALLVSYGEGLMVTTREQLFGDGVKRGEMLEVEQDLSGMLGHPIAQSEVSGIIEDYEKRKWIATMGDGIFCISEDRKTLLAHIVKEAGGLPSDVCVSIAYDPETRSIWVGTDKGIAQYIPAGSAQPATLGRSIRVVPGVIEPDYYGYVIINGLEDGVAYEVRDERGESVMTIKPSDGRVSIESGALPRGVNGIYAGEDRVAEIFKN